MFLIVNDNWKWISVINISLLQNPINTNYVNWWKVLHIFFRIKNFISILLLWLCYGLVDLCVFLIQGDQLYCTLPLGEINGKDEMQNPEVVTYVFEIPEKISDHSNYDIYKLPLVKWREGEKFFQRLSKKETKTIQQTTHETLPGCQLALRLIIQ